jgi:hypothetical protein
LPVVRPGLILAPLATVPALEGVVAERSLVGG